MTIVHDLNVGEVILDRSIRFPPGSLLKRPRTDWTTASVLGVSVYLIHRNGGFGPQRVSHSMEHVDHKGTKALVPGTVTYLKTLEMNKWSRCSITWQFRSYSAHKRRHHCTLGRHLNNRRAFILKSSQCQNTQQQESSISFIKSTILSL